MPRVAIPINIAILTGVLESTPPTAGDASNDHYVANNDGRIVLRAKNTGSVTQTITFKTKFTVQGMTLQDNIGTVQAGGAKWFGPFSPGIFDSTGGALFIDIVDNTWEFIAINTPASS